LHVVKCLVQAVLNRYGGSEAKPTFIIEPIGKPLVDLATDNDRQREQDLWQVAVDDWPHVVDVEGERSLGHFKAGLELEVEPCDEDDDAEGESHHGEGDKTAKHDALPRRVKEFHFTGDRVQM